MGKEKVTLFKRVEIRTDVEGKEVCVQVLDDEGSVLALYDIQLHLSDPMIFTAINGVDALRISLTYTNDRWSVACTGIPGRPIIPVVLCSGSAVVSEDKAPELLIKFTLHNLGVLVEGVIICDGSGEIYE